MASVPFSCLSFQIPSSVRFSDAPKVQSWNGRQVRFKQLSIGLHCYVEDLGSGRLETLSLRCQNSTTPDSDLPESIAHSDDFHRRQVIIGGLVTSLSLHFLSNAAHGLPTGNPISKISADVQTSVQLDEINAYSYLYPVSMDVKPSTFKWVESRKPERYSSAAPLSPNARQRIVSERLDIKNNLVLSVSVGPPNSAFLKTAETDSWDAKDVARSVLADKSTSRMTTGQRVAEIEILDSSTEDKDGIRYWYYEYVVQKSPTIQERSPDVYRHSLAVTAEREGYLYSLNASTAGSKWSYFSPMFRQSVSSFRLNPPTPEYVPPDQDPWRFW